MSQERSEAIVLRGVDFSETSRIVTFLSPERGRLACLAAGVRRPKSQVAGLLDTFNRLELIYYWKDGRSVQKLAEATLLDDYAAVKGNLAKSVYAAFAVELVYKVAHEGEPSNELYASLAQGLEGLAGWTGDVPLHVAWQTMRLLVAAGFGPTLDACARCGAAVTHASGFDLDGGVTCPRCRADRPLTERMHHGLRRLLDSKAACPSGDSGPELFALLSAYAARQIDSDFRSVRVIHQMFGEKQVR